MRSMRHIHSDDLLLEDFRAQCAPLRLAVVTETWPPEVNGVALTLARLVKGLCAAGHAVQLVRPRQTATDQASCDSSFEERLMRGMPIPRYPQLKMGLPAKRALLKLWAHQRPDLVHIATEGPLGWSALQAARKLHLPVTSDFRTNFDSYTAHYGLGWLKRPIAAYLRKFHNLTDVTMVPTASLAQQLTGSGFKNIQVVARGVDTSVFNPAQRSEALRDAWGAGSTTRVLLSVGRLAPEKNLQLVVDSYRAVRAAGVPAILVFAGDGPMRAELQSACPDAVFLGMRDHTQLARDYASADALLFPSLTETFGNVTVEALACACPVLAFDVAAARDWVRHGQTGWLASAADNAAFQRMCVDVCAPVHVLPQARQALVDNSATLDWHTVTQQVERIWRDRLLEAPKLIAAQESAQWA
jgi:glycosyltransferase involved in cell wall biosynthesis